MCFYVFRFPSEAGPVIQYQMKQGDDFFFVCAKCEYSTYMWNRRPFCVVDTKDVAHIFFLNGQFQLNCIGHISMLMFMRIMFDPPPS